MSNGHIKKTRQQFSKTASLSAMDALSDPVVNMVIAMECKYNGTSKEEATKAFVSAYNSAGQDLPDLT